MSAVPEVIEAEPIGWTANDRSRGRELGSKAVAEKAAHLHQLWADHIVQLLIEAHAFSRTCPTRATLIDGLRSFNLTHRLSGKGGGQIKRGTISRWLSNELENALRVKAIDDLIAMERIKHQ